MSEVRLSRVLGPAFHLLARDVFQHGHTHYDLSGGRGSLKSSCVSLLVPLLLVTNPGTHALVLRKVANTIRDSVYAQYLWAIDTLGMAAYWEAKVQPMELIYRPTGQKILFRGADDPMKIKSIKVPFGYLAVTHFEEKDQFAGRAEIRTVLQSTMRGGPRFWNFESYNPPVSRDNWANRDSLEERADRLCHKSTYLDAPPAWLGEQFLREAEHLRETDERAYRHEYLGIPVGTGGDVFDNLELREITDREIASFDRIYQGVDWGYMPDPFAFIRAHYDKARETIYLIDEIYRNRLSNEQSANIIKERGYLDAYVDERYRATLEETPVLPSRTREERRMKEMIYLNFKWFMQTLLDRKDRMSMYSGLEVRVPFCDYRIAEYLYAVPWEYKDYRNCEKGLLRQAMAGLLPEEVLWRKKSPYPKTHHPGYLEAVASELRDVLRDSSSPLLSIVDAAALERLFNSALSVPWYGQLMTIPQTIAYMLQVNYWMKKYRVRIV